MSDDWEAGYIRGQEMMAHSLRQWLHGFEELPHRATELEAIVHDLAASEPLYRHCSGSECMVCDGWPGNPDAHNHDPSCPWRRARELQQGDSE